MRLTEIEIRVLRAMATVASESCSQKSVVVLRYALLETRTWDDKIEESLCCEGTEHPVVAELYHAIRKLVCETNYADGAGDLYTPAGPRYTECWITKQGRDHLDNLT
jgi:hypothetical protein